MRRGLIATLCAIAVVAMIPAQAQDTKLPMSLAEKAAFCGLETAMALVGDVIEHQGCPKTRGSYDLDVSVYTTGGTNVYGTIWLDNVTLEVGLLEDSSKGQQWGVTMPTNGDFDNVRIGKGSVDGFCSNTTQGEIIIGNGELTINGDVYDWTFIKDLYQTRLQWNDEKAWTIVDKGLEVITKLGYPRQKYRQNSKYRRSNGGDGLIWWKKTRITPTNAPDCKIIINKQRVDNWVGGFEIFQGTLTVK